MTTKLFISFCGEGHSDNVFIKNITERVVIDYLLQKNIDAEISWTYIRKKGSSTESYLESAALSQNQHLLIYHRDADCDNRNECLQNHFQEGDVLINNNRDMYCHHIVKAIPIQETEAWMLSDKELLKSLINTDLSNQDLNFTYQIGNIENVANPKERVEAAISTHRNYTPPRRRKLIPTLSELYEPFSQQVSVDSISRVPSCQQLIEDIRNVIDEIFEN